MERVCNGVRLFFTEKGQGNQTFLCIHNTGGDHRLFTPQLEFFSQFGRVVVPDLRGHGKSDKPKKKYSIEVFREDLVSLCKDLSLHNVIAIGSSTGGNIALDLACHYTDLVKAAVMIDCGMFLSPKVRKKIREYKEKMKQEEISFITEEILEDSCLPTDQCKELMRNAYQAVPYYVWRGVFASLLTWDRKNKIRLPSCKIPILYIEASSPSSDRSQLANLKEFFKYYPPLITGKVVGSGHYPSLEVPDQVNAMVLQFLRIRRILL
ncbi:MAG: alpha/beta hydrolase [Chlamydiae bacterium]|nr:alpha/beta hydrolase [Chlamydiota bacterium]